MLQYLRQDSWDEADLPKRLDNSGRILYFINIIVLRWAEVLANQY